MKRSQRLMWIQVDSVRQYGEDGQSGRAEIERLGWIKEEKESCKWRKHLNRWDKTEDTKGGNGSEGFVNTPGNLKWGN